MNNTFESQKKVLKANLFICLFLVALSFIGLFFNEYPLILCVLICSSVNILNTFLLIKSTDANPDSIGGRFIVFSILRFVLLLIGLVLSALIIYLTMGENFNSIRYIMVAIGAIPYLISPITLALFSR